MNTLESPTKTSHCTSQLIFLSGHLVTWLFDFGSGSRWPITVQGKGKSWLSRPPTPRLLIKTVYATTAAVCQAVIMQSSSRLAPIAFLLFLHDSPSSCDCSLHFTVTFCHCSFFPGSSIFQTPHDLVIPPFAHSSHPELVCGAFFFLAHFSLPPSLTHSLPHSFFTFNPPFHRCLTFQLEGCVLIRRRTPLSPAGMCCLYPNTTRAQIRTCLHKGSWKWALSGEP